MYSAIANVNVPEEILLDLHEDKNGFTKNQVRKPTPLGVGGCQF